MSRMEQDDSSWIGQVYDTGGGSLAEIVGEDCKGWAGAAHLAWRDRRLDQWWTKTMLPLTWKLVDNDE